MKKVYSANDLFSQDGVDLSRNRTNRLIKTLEEFEENDTEKLLRRGKTFKVISSNPSPELGDKSQSSPSLGTDISHQQTQPADKDPNNITDKEENNSSNLHGTGRENEINQPCRSSMMNEYDSD